MIGPVDKNDTVLACTLPERRCHLVLRSDRLKVRLDEANVSGRLKRPFRELHQAQRNGVGLGRRVEVNQPLM